jgi:hypothetical protein
MAQDTDAGAPAPPPAERDPITDEEGGPRLTDEEGGPRLTDEEGGPRPTEPDKKG